MDDISIVGGEKAGRLAGFRDLSITPSREREGAARTT